MVKKNQSRTYLNHLVILGGDFNCVLEAKDTTGHANYSRSLAILTQGYALSDAWQTHHNRKVYTHYTAQNAARLDRFYLTQNLMNRKQKIETLPAAFTVHFAVSLQISMTTIAQGRALWKLNPETLKQRHIIEKIKDHWKKMETTTKLVPQH